MPIIVIIQIGDIIQWLQLLIRGIHLYNIHYRYAMNCSNMIFNERRTHQYVYIRYDKLDTI